MERKRYCVYNQTRESFLSLGVGVANTVFTRLKGLIGKLTLRLDEGLWVVPSIGIHTVGVRFALDLVYLDEDYRVIHVVESFPTFRIAPLKPEAASVLELPTHTIYSSQTNVGDQLLICQAEEMENWLAKERPKLSRQVKPITEVEKQPMASLISRMKDWFSEDRRRAARKPAPGLVAYYWTGAAPEEHAVRDVSETGLFLVTEERWYPGTVVTMTLQKTDKDDSTQEHAIAIQSKAVRWGEDGVGLKFVVPETPKRETAETSGDRQVDKKTLGKFLQRFLGTK
jgi:uncharacterized membrane protein (UPF0127 family)